MATTHRSGDDERMRGAPRSRGQRTCVAELPPQATVDQVFLATRKQLRPNRHGQLYLQVELADRSGSITGRLWNASEDDFEAFVEGDYVRVDGTTQLYSGTLQLIVTSVVRVDPRTVDEEEFAVVSTTELARLDAELRTLVTTVGPGPLRDLVDEVLADEPLLRAFARVPAGVKHHHAHVGGLLQHVVTLLRLVDRVAPLYPAIDRDLLLVGALLHDVGKTQELEGEKGFSYTDAGQLLGHVLQGLEIVAAKIAAVESRTGRPFDAELAMRVKHMIASHHGLHEYGAAKLPMTLEALALHYLDALDSKLAGVLQLMQTEASLEGGWTQYQPSHGRKYYRGPAR